LVSTAADVVIRRCRLVDHPQLVDLEVRGGRLSGVGPNLPEASEELDADGRLVAPTFVEPHYHLDKCFTGEESLELRTLDEYIAAEAARKRRFTVEDISERAGRVIEQLVANGVTRMRSQVDVDTSAELRGFEGVQAVADRYRDLIDIQLVAFPQQGILQDPGSEELLREAMRRGATAVGGHPQLEICRADSVKHIATVFDIAEEFDADVDMHVDETDDPASTFIHDIAVETLRRGRQGRVACGHVCALALYNPYYATKVIELIRRADITVIANPTSNLLFRALLDPEPRWRGLTRVRELLEAGVNVAFGQETVKSTYIVTLRNPDPLLTAQILAHGAGMKSLRDMDRLWLMMTSSAARALSLTGYGLAIGSRADLNVFDAETAAEAIASIAPRRWVLREGRVVAETRVDQHLVRGREHVSMAPSRSG
jgi:cytosine deaminase